MDNSSLDGVTISHYRILAKIGEGGMGEVYRAEDTRLHRKVALKILPAEVASSQDRMRRFNQEAQAAAALNHPNIAHIYEIGESEGRNFIAMEFIDNDILLDTPLYSTCYHQLAFGVNATTRTLTNLPSLKEMIFGSLDSR